MRLRRQDRSDTIEAGHRHREAGARRRVDRSDRRAEDRLTGKCQELLTPPAPLSTESGAFCFFDSMIVWRYLASEYAVAAFETGDWKIGRVSELNDPLDCRPAILSSRSTNISPIGDPYLVKHFIEMVGLLCYSEKIDDPAVWAHYGRNHTGVAFGFRFPDGPEKTTKVKYLRRRPRVYMDDLKKAKGEDLRKVVMRGWNSKAPGWRFEAEHRHFISMTPGAVEYRRPHFFRRVPWERLKYVVLGVRCPLSILELMHLNRRIPGLPDGVTAIFQRAELDPLINRIDPRLPMKEGKIHPLFD
ncbi:MAG: DUF2971 domain-containing protein [Verrucomicrobiaceae bacterium]|nr:MAG: DUF2971 domain-containing protein [Verrucomicrobiaceae bacterium]